LDVEEQKILKQEIKLNNEINNESKLGKIEKEFVHNVYEKIAGHFSDTRYRPWPAIKNYLMKLDDYSVVADIGCGNGKYLPVNPKLVMIGSDITFNLLKICQDRSFNVFQADNLNLPIRP
jgi:ubiquinone/menaquinone biosynthesis C-methylase UbiE